MFLFLMAAGFIGMLLYSQILRAFMANPGLNGLIGGVFIARHCLFLSSDYPSLS